MAIQVCVLASGSAANCISVASPTTRILIDAGMSARETERRCGELGLDLASVAAICVTHEHDDHRGGLRVLHRRYGMALYANRGTIDALARDERLRSLDWRIFTTGQAFTVGDLELMPFSVPHDSYDPVGFVVCGGGRRIGIVTDMGMATSLIRERLSGCDLIVMESNYDDDMLRDSPRPWSLKQRIIGRQGHLSNAQAGELLAQVAGPQLRAVILSHLSAECNHPTHALHTVRGALERAGHGHVEVKLAYADRVSETVEV